MSNPYDNPLNNPYDDINNGRATDSEKSSIAVDVGNSLNSAKAQMKTYSNRASSLDSVINTIPGMIDSVKNDKYELNQPGKVRQLHGLLNEAHSMSNSTSNGVVSLRKNYRSMSLNYHDLTQGNIGEQLAKQTVSAKNAQNVKASNVNFKNRMSSDPNFYSSVMNVRSASASLNNVSPAKRRSMLNSFEANHYHYD